MGYDTAGADHGIASDVHAGQNDCTASDPDIVADRDRHAIFESCVPGIRVYRMTGGIDGDIGGHLAVHANGDFRDINDGAIVIGEEVSSDMNVLAVIAVERRIDPCIPFTVDQGMNYFCDGFRIAAV